MPSSHALRALLWTAAFTGALVAATLVAGPATLALRGIGFEAEMGAVFRRTLLVAVVSVLLLGLHPWRDRPAGTWGLHGPTARPKDAAGGVGIAFVLLGVLLAGEWAAGWFSFDRAKGIQKLASRAPALLVTAVGIAFLEEIFFRGWVLGRFLRRLRPLSAAAATSALFALPHLFKETTAPHGLPTNPSGAWAALSAWAGAALDLSVSAPRMAGMFLLGLALAAGFLRTRSLWLGIGLHGGAVFFVQALSALTDRAPERNWAGSKWLYDGPLGWVAIGLLALLLWPRKSRDPSVVRAPTAP